MGFQRRPYKLVWPEDSQWHGLEVSLRGMTLEELEEIVTLKTDVDGTSSLNQMKPILDILDRALTAWNYEDESGTAIPVKEFRHQDVALLLAIIQGWQGVVGQVAPPLKPPSSDGGKSEEGLIPMEIPSSSHPNLNGQS